MGHRIYVLASLLWVNFSNEIILFDPAIFFILIWFVNEHGLNYFRRVASVRCTYVNIYSLTLLFRFCYPVSVNLPYGLNFRFSLSANIFTDQFFSSHHGLGYPGFITYTQCAACCELEHDNRTETATKDFEQALTNFFCCLSSSSRSRTYSLNGASQPSVFPTPSFFINCHFN